MRQILFALAIFLLVPITSQARSGPPYEQRVSDAAAMSVRIEKFANVMKKLGFNGEIRSCKLMVQQAVGVRGGNISYGAICTIHADNRLQEVMMCDDDMVGHYALKALTFVMSEDAVAEFTRKNCYGG